MTVTHAESLVTFKGDFFQVNFIGTMPKRCVTSQLVPVLGVGVGVGVGGVGGEEPPHAANVNATVRVQVRFHRVSVPDQDATTPHGLRLSRFAHCAAD